MNLSNSWFLAALVGIIGWFHVKLVAEFLNLSRLSKEVPEGLRDAVTEDDQVRAAEYASVSAKWSIYEDAAMLGLTIAFWLSGGFAWLDRWTVSLGYSPVVTGLLLLAVLVAVQTLLSLPFEVNNTFRVEAEFGFNKTTPGTFIVDRLKGLALTALLGLPLGALVLWLFETQPLAALYGWVVVTLFGLLVSWAAPRFLMPLFMKFTPLEAGPLRDAILALGERLQFPVQEIYRVDGSRRSSKANAFFTGFGKSKRIALFDTLLTGHSQEEIVAVLAHEIGHAKLKHVPQQLVMGLLQSALLFGLLHFALHDARLFAAFGVQHPSYAMGLVLFSMVYGPWSNLWEVPLQGITRRHEFEADAFAAAAVGSGETLASGLKRLSKDHMAHLTPHPFYVWLHHSHPPVLERLRALGQ